jgi:hypothetical protein
MFRITLAVARLCAPTFAHAETCIASHWVMADTGRRTASGARGDDRSSYCSSIRPSHTRSPGDDNQFLISMAFFILAALISAAFLASPGGRDSASVCKLSAILIQIPAIFARVTPHHGYAPKLSFVLPNLGSLALFFKRENQHSGRPEPCEGRRSLR